jgi:general secretion pathway protein A
MNQSNIVGRAPARSLYLEHFGLNREPFNNTPDPTFLYWSSSHSEALAQLIYGVRARKGFVVLTGEVGTGKTTLIHALMRELEDNTKTALILNTILNSRDFLRSTCQEFGLIPEVEEPKEIYDYLQLLNQFLLQAYRTGDSVALIIDEAQNLSASVLESIPMLSNFETSQHKLLQILMAGQPELNERLNSPELRQLKQRVVLWHRLRSLTLDDCKEYVHQRLRLVGGSSSVFSPEAIEAVYRYSEGTPRLINILCDNGMLTAYALQVDSVRPEMIREIAEDLHLTGPLRELESSKSVSLKNDLGSKQNGMQERKGDDFIGLTSAGEASPRKQENIPFSVMAKSVAKDNGQAPPTPSTHSNPIDCVPPAFFEELITELTEGMGPLAALVLYDHVARLGELLDRFPKARLTELVDSVSQEIANESLRKSFHTEMHEHLRQLALPKRRS